MSTWLFSSIPTNSSLALGNVFIHFRVFACQLSQHRQLSTINVSSFLEIGKIAEIVIVALLSLIISTFIWEIKSVFTCVGRQMRFSKWIVVAWGSWLHNDAHESMSPAWCRWKLSVGLCPVRTLFTSHRRLEDLRVEADCMFRNFATNTTYDYSKRFYEVR